MEYLVESGENGMKCFSCGKENDFYICESCLRNNNYIEKVLNQLFLPKFNERDNININLYFKSFKNIYEERNKVINEVLNKYYGDKKDFYKCRFLNIIKSDEFEVEAIKYLKSSTTTILSKDGQILLSSLLYSYLRKDFTKPLEWCKLILNSDDMYIELYNVAAEYFSMVGEYDLSESLINKAMSYMENDSCSFIFSNKENMIISFNKLKSLLVRYRNGKPYFPKTEERQKQIIEIYKKKGIVYSETSEKSLKSRKVKEGDFKKINECMEYNIDSYCSFWCEIITINGITDVYQIAAIKVVDNEIVDNFEKYIKPWDGKKYVEIAAKKANISFDEFNSFENVDDVINDFCKFVGNNILISTDALGNQLKYLTRAYRWARLDHFDNTFLELLDFAADVNEVFDMNNNNRDFLLKTFKLKDEKNALSKAYNNILIFNKLKEMK